MKFPFSGRQIRHFTLLFAAGMTWGYLGKVIANKYMYTGYDDSQAAQSRGHYEIKKVFTEEFVPEGGEDSDSLLESPSLDEEVAPSDGGILKSI